MVTDNGGRNAVISSGSSLNRAVETQSHQIGESDLKVARGEPRKLSVPNQTSAQNSGGRLSMKRSASSQNNANLSPKVNVTF